MPNYDKGLQELLDLLKTKRGLIREIVFDTDNIETLFKGKLRRKAARRLAVGVDPKTFLMYVGGPQDGFPVAVCLKHTDILCAKGSAIVLCGRTTTQ